MKTKFHTLALNWLTMKVSPISPFLVAGVLLSSCAGAPDDVAKPSEKVPMEPVAIAGNTISEDSQDRVRSPEVIKAYPNGRYIDPNDPNIMHEKGVIYRKEQDPQWNLSPNGEGFLPVGPAPPVADPNKAPSPLTAEIQNELENQKKYTATIIEQNEAMAKRLEALNAQADQFKGVLDQNAVLKVENDKYSQQIETLTKKIDVLTSPPPPQPSWWDQTRKLLHLDGRPKAKAHLTDQSTNPQLPPN